MGGSASGDRSNAFRARHPSLRKSLRELGVASSALGSSALGGGGGGMAFPGAGDATPGSASSAAAASGGVGSGSGSGSGSGGGALSYASEAAAHRLLARSGRGFDSAQFGRDARELETRSHIAASSSAAAAAAAAATGTTPAGGAGTGTIASLMAPGTPFGVRSGLLLTDRSTPGSSVGFGTPGGAGAGMTANAGGIGGAGGGRGVQLQHHPSSSAAGAAAVAAPDLATFLSRNHAANVLRILSSTRIDAETSANGIVCARMQQDWTEERVHLARGMGMPHLAAAQLQAHQRKQQQQQQQHHGGPAAATAAPATPGGPATPYALRFGSSGAPTPAYDRGGGRDAATAASATNAAGGVGGGGLLGPASLTNITDFVSSTAQVTPPAPLNGASVGAHATLVADLNDSRRRALLNEPMLTGGEGGGGAAAGGLMSAEEMLMHIKEILSNGISTYAAPNTATAAGGGQSSLHAAAIQAVDRGYNTALDVVGALVMMSATSTNGSSDTTRSNAAGSLLYLAEQFRSHILSRVRSSAMSGSAASAEGGGGSNNGFANDVATYVNLELGHISSSGAVTGAAVSPWRKLYRCLRCGDVAAALATIQHGFSSVGGAGNDDDTAAAVAAVVKALAKFQGGKNSVWSAAATSGGGIEGLLSSVPSAAIDAVVELCHGSANTSSQGDGEASYRTACLSLLCLGQSRPGIGDGGGADAAGGSGSSAAASTVEDYLYEALWSAFFQQSNDACTAAVSNLGASVRHWGPAHFEEEDDTGGGGMSFVSDTGTNQPPLSGGWSYAIPLLASQQFESALTYLARVGGPAGLLQATHLAILMHLARIDLGDLTSGSISGGERGGRVLLTSLLSSYASTLQEARAALEYLVLIPDPVSAGASRSIVTTSRTAKAYVQGLILESRAFEALAGLIGPDGKRVPPSQDMNGRAGALDAHFSPSEVSSLLAGAADDARRRSNAADAAELLSLAGKYADLLSVLNSELASLLVVDDADADMMGQRQFWRSAADAFHNLHLSGGPNHVMANLEVERRLDLGGTFKLIMNLMVFFDRCQARDWEGAWTLIDALGVFPSTEDDMSRSVANYQTLDSILKGKPFRHAAIGAMESLYQQHSVLKARLGGSQTSEAAGAINQGLEDLRARARLLVTFVGLCRLEGDVSARIARMEAYMV